MGPQEMQSLSAGRAAETDNYRADFCLRKEYYVGIIVLVCNCHVSFVLCFTLLLLVMLVLSRAAC